MHGPRYKEAARDTISVLKDEAERQKIDLDLEDDEGLTAFTIALSERGEDTYVSEAFFDCGMRPPEDVFGMAILSGASNYENASKLRLVFDRLGSSGLDWLDLLKLAIDNDALEAVRLLLKSGDISLLSSQDADLKTPLHWAAEAGKVSIVECLLELGADPDIFDRFGIPPVGYALLCKSKESTNMLLDHGANPWLNDGEYKNGTVMFFGLSREPHNSISMLGFLLSADLDEGEPPRFPKLHDCHLLDTVVPGKGVTVLHEAARLGDYEGVFALVSAGASALIKDKSGKTPLDEANLALAAARTKGGEGKLELEEELISIVSFLQDQ